MTDEIWHNAVFPITNHYKVTDTEPSTYVMWQVSNEIDTIYRFAIMETNDQAAAGGTKYPFPIYVDLKELNHKNKDVLHFYNVFLY